MALKRITRLARNHRRSLGEGKFRDPHLQFIYEVEKQLEALERLREEQEARTITSSHY
jgi:hypothetical protein